VKQVTRTHLRKLTESGLPTLVDVRFAVCAREQVTHADPDVLVVTAADIFGPPR
jgi:hypothetical protein